MKKRGFTLVELLAVIIIIGLIAVIVVPILSNTITDAKRDTFEETVEAIVREMRNYATKIEMKTGIPFENQVLSVTSSELEYKGDRSKFEGTVLIDANGKIAIEMNNGTYCAKKSTSDSSIEVTKLRNQVCDGSEILENFGTEYTEADLNGTDPVLIEGLIPITISADGTVKKASTKLEWYNYKNKNWANAVILNGTDTYTAGQTIPLDQIKAYFVWIPKYSYELFDLGLYTNYNSMEPTESKARSIQIKFGTNNTSDATNGECTTPMTSRNSGNCVIGDYMTHPAFLSLNKTGIWVAKFETTGSIDAPTVLPGETSVKSQTVSAMYSASLTFQPSMSSHMMKNTEWGAVAILSHSKYGMNDEIRINNYNGYKTGYAAADGTDQSSYPGTYGTAATVTQPYNTETGYKASTTGNITGVYDMSGGVNEYMAAFTKDTYGDSGITADIIATHPEYFDVYESGGAYNPSRRILGDATGEMGPFYDFKDNDGDARNHNAWYTDHSHFVNSPNPWFYRGGHCRNGVLAGQFNFHHTTGGANGSIGFRLVLAP